MLSDLASSLPEVPLPHVTVYNEISLDGRIEGFATDAVRYYRQALSWRVDAILMGSVTAASFGPAESAEEQAGSGPVVEAAPVVPGFEDLVYEPRPLLVVPDSAGRVRNWRHAQAQPWYGGYLALVARHTPADHLAYLDRRGVDHLSCGDHRVDLAEALRELREHHGVESVLTDGGGALNGALFAAGMVDEVAVLLDPVVSGLSTARSLVQLPHDRDGAGIWMRLCEVERLADGVLLLRYQLPA